MMEELEPEEMEESVRTLSFGRDNASEPMADETDPQSTFVSIAVGLAGILLGAMALFLNFSGSDRMELTKTAVLEMDNRVETLENEIKALADAVAAMDKTSENKSSSVRALARDTRSVLERAGAEIRQNRESLDSLDTRIDELTGQVATLRERMASGQRIQFPVPVATEFESAAQDPAPAPEPTNSAMDNATEAGSSQNPQFHTVRSGESFWVIARRYGIDVQEIQLANPGVDPDRLSVGTRLRIPSLE